MEEYKKVNNYNTYSISNNGNVRNDNTNHILKPQINKGGYYRVVLHKNGIMKSNNIHRLVAVAFIENSDNKPCIDHINNDKLNNNINNLRWCTYQENNRNASIRSDNSSGVKGVSFHKRDKKWESYIIIHGIKNHLGSFNTKEEAIQARLNKAKKEFGIYINACELNELKPKIQKIINDVVKLKNSYINDILKIKNKLHQVLNM